MPVRFADFTFDLESRELRRQGVVQPLEPKAFALLALLLAERPRALAKAELHERLWPDVVVSESHLSSLMAEVRQALGDDPRRPAFVRTVHGFGYAFCAAAAEVGAVPLPRLRLYGEGGEVVLLDGINVIGRGEEATVRLRSARASRQHARILVRDGRAVLEDLGSKNGTRLRGTRLQAPVPLADGDEITIGGETFTFRVLQPAAETQTDVSPGGA